MISTDDALHDILGQFMRGVKYALIRCPAQSQAVKLKGRLYSASRVRGWRWNFSVSGTDVVVWK